MPNDPPRADEDGEWLNVPSQRQTTLTLHTYLDQLCETAVVCSDQGWVIIEPLEAFDGEFLKIGDNGYIVAWG